VSRNIPLLNRRQKEKEEVGLEAYVAAQIHMRHMQILAEATRLGESRPADWKSPKIMGGRDLVFSSCCLLTSAVVIYNPISGGGAAKKLVYDLVVPVLDACVNQFSAPVCALSHFQV
jgi:hypothetical protein